MDKQRRNLWAVILGFALLAAVVALAWPRRAKPAVSIASSTSHLAANPVGSNTAANATTTHSIIDELATAATSLRSASNRETARQLLEKLRVALSALPPDKAAQAIRQFLDSKADAPTREGFSIGTKGFLAEAPSLRTFLLDYLGQVDPAAAAAYARVILSSKDSPDEWAVALRNLARGEGSPEGLSLLADKTGDLLRHGAWQQNPSVGYLEAFDTAVFLGGTNLVPTLTDLVRKQDNPAVAHAAFLALDRMVINDPASMLRALETAPDLMQGREPTRANYFARADVRDPEQRQVLEQYLVNSQIGAAELDQFAGLYPSANYMISKNLLTSTPTPDHAALASRDAESLRVVDQWLADARFANLRPQLEKIRTRLAGFVRQAK